jgi:protein-tyrosine phosphatase
MSVSILFVCLGNICRSPTAHGVLLQKLTVRGLAATVRVDSAGTGGWHAGEAPDRRTQRHAAARGYDLSSLRARQVEAADFRRFSHVLAMDRANLDDLESMKPPDFTGELGLFLRYGSRGVLEVPDPYYGGSRGFEEVLDLVEDAAEGLIVQLGVSA